MVVKVSNSSVSQKLGIKGVSKPLVALLAALALAGCASNPDSGTADSSTGVDSTETQSASSDGGFEGGTSGDVDSSAVAQAASEAEAALRQATVFYFDYDLAELKPEAFEPLKAHARYLVANSSAMARLEGHADERGTREYNIALGERRANAVAKFLKVQGVKSSQLDVISYGEERPSATGHDEKSWAMNRRVEISY